MEKIDMIWTLFKMYLNDPNYYVRQDDVLVNILMRGKEDLDKMCNSLGIPLNKRKSDMTFRELLKLCKIC